MATTLTPRLILRDVDAALDFYRRALGAEVKERFAAPDGTVVHAAMTIGDVTFTLGEENSQWSNAGPATLGGSPVILNLVVEDVDATVDRFLAAGADVVFPLADQFYGHREGRFRDPFGHLWIMTTVMEELSPEEIDRRLAAFMAQQLGG